jgi:hypothetical protein
MFHLVLVVREAWASLYISIRQRTSAYVNHLVLVVREAWASLYISIRQHTLATWLWWYGRLGLLFLCQQLRLPLL